MGFWTVLACRAHKGAPGCMTIHIQVRGQRTDDDGDGLLLADGGLAALDLVQEDAEVGLGGDGGGQLGDQVVVVGVEELRHVQRFDAGHAARHRKVLLVARQALRATMQGPSAAWIAAVDA